MQCCVYSGCGNPRHLHSFPTRRSSDLSSRSSLARVMTPITPRESVTSHVPGSLGLDRKSTRLNSSHVKISYAVFCLKKKNNHHRAAAREHAVVLDQNRPHSPKAVRVEY